MTTPVPPSSREAGSAQVEAGREAARSKGRDRWERALQRYLEGSMQQSLRNTGSPPSRPAGEAAQPPEESRPRVPALQALLRAFGSINLRGIFPRRR